MTDEQITEAWLKKMGLSNSVNQDQRNTLEAFCSYVLASSSTASVSAELQRLKDENKELAEFVIAVGGFWGNSKSNLVGECSLADSINRAYQELADLREDVARLHADKMALLEKYKFGAASVSEPDNSQAAVLSAEQERECRDAALESLLKRAWVNSSYETYNAIRTLVKEMSSAALSASANKEPK